MHFNFRPTTQSTRVIFKDHNQLIMFKFNTYRVGAVVVKSKQALGTDRGL